MLGAIIGDIVGSPYEHGSEKTKCFPFLTDECRPTDDTILTIAVGGACVNADVTDEEDFKSAVIRRMRELARQYPDAGFGESFFRWASSNAAGAYESCGNGSAMRVSPVAWVAGSLREAERLAKWSAEVTHNHPDGIAGAQAVAAAIYMARQGADKEEIRDYVSEHYYPLDFTVDGIRERYRHSIICRESVPEAIVAFLDSTGFEDAVRNAISLGGDGDTQAAIAGAIAEAYYGIPEELEERIFSHLDENLTDYYLEYAEELYS